MAVLLALLTSVLYGVSNYLGPTLSRTAPLYAVLLTGQSVALVAAIGLAVATAATFPTDMHLVAALIAGLGNGLGLLAFYRAAQLGPLSIVTPVGALGAIVPVTAGFASGDAGGAASRGPPARRCASECSSRRSSPRPRTGSCGPSGSAGSPC